MRGRSSERLFGPCECVCGLNSRMIGNTSMGMDALKVTRTHSPPRVNQVKHVIGRSVVPWAMIQSGSRAADAKVHERRVPAPSCPRQRLQLNAKRHARARERKIVGVSTTNTLPQHVHSEQSRCRSGPPMCPPVLPNHPGNHRLGKTHTRRFSSLIRLMRNVEKGGKVKICGVNAGKTTPTFAFSAHTRTHPPAVIRRSTTGGAGSRVWHTRTYNVCVRRPLSTP
jgi:hypothetical protein